jgi:hypothetical protein
MDDSLVVVAAKARPDTVKIWEKDIKDTIIKTSLGTIININNSSYVLTCSHGLRNAYELIIYKFGKNMEKYSVSKVIDAYELDIALLKINYSTKNSARFSSDFPVVDSRLRFYIKNLFNRTPGFELHNCSMVKVTYEKYCSFNMPLLPLLHIKLLDTLNEYTGVSGACVLDQNNNIVGIISNVRDDTKLLCLVPTVSIMRVIKEVEKYGSFNGICGIVADLKETDNGYLVAKSYDINYNHSSDRADFVGGNIRTDDIIVYNGETHINSFIALNFMSDDKIPLNIIRTNSKYVREEKNIVLKARSLRTLKYIPMLDSKKFVQYAGLTFVELSEELLELYNNKGIRPTGHTLKYYTKTPYRNNSDESIIVLIDINKSLVPTKVIGALDKAVGGNLLQLTRVNKKKVQNLNMLESALGHRKCRLNLTGLSLDVTDKIESIYIV